MAIQQRIFILLGAILAFAFVCQRIRKDKILVEDSIFWVVLSVVLVIIAIFPGIAIWCGRLFGFISPINFVYTLLIALLLVKAFGNSAEISMLKSKVNDLAQEVALKDELNQEEKDAEADKANAVANQSDGTRIPRS